MRRRHPNVYDRDVGPIPTNAPQHSLGIFRLTHDVNASVLEQTDYPLSGNQDVICNDYAHGISARTIMGPTFSVPPSAPTRSADRTIAEVRSEPSSCTLTTSHSSSRPAVTAA